MKKNKTKVINISANIVCNSKVEANPTLYRTHKIISWRIIIALCMFSIFTDIISYLIKNILSLVFSICITLGLTIASFWLPSIEIIKDDITNKKED